MKNKLVAGIILATFLLAVAVPVLAGYYANLQVVESSGNSYDQVALNQTLDIDYLADNGYITSTGLDTRVTSGGTAIPHMLMEDMLLFSTDITAHETSNLLFTTGNIALSSFPVITGYGGNVTISDHTNLELGNDFVIEIEGWIDVAAPEHTDDIHYPTVEATNTSIENTAMTSHSVDLPIGIESGDLLLVFFGARLTSVSGTITWTDGWTELAQGTGSNIASGAAYKVASGSEGSAVTIATSVTAYSAHQTFRIANYQGVPEISSSATGLPTATPNSPSLTPSWGSAKTLWVTFFGGQNAAGDRTLSSYPSNYSNGQFTKTTTGQGYVGSARRNLIAVSEDPGAFTLSGSIYWYAWTIGIQGTTGDAIILKDDAFALYVDDVGKLSASILGTPRDVAATGLSSGEYLVEVWADGTDFGIDVDGVEEDTTALSGASVPNNANNWSISMPYFNCYNHTIGVNHRIRYEPDAIIVGTTLPNEENPGTYDGTITWGSNPSGVAVSISGLVSDFQPEPAGGTGQLPTPLDVVGPSGQPGWTAGIQSLTTHPLYPLVLSVSDQTNIPVPLVWVLGATLILAMVMVWMIGDRQILHQMLIALAGGGWAAFCYHMGIYPFWVIYIYAVLALAIIIGERSPTVS